MVKLSPKWFEQKDHALERKFEKTPFPSMDFYICGVWSCFRG